MASSPMRKLDPVCCPWRSPHSPFLVRQLRPPPGQPEGMIVVSLFPDLTRSSCGRICQMFLEQFTVLERPAAQIYTLNALNSLEARVLLGRYFRSLEWVLVEARQDERSCGHATEACLASFTRVLRTNSFVRPLTSKQPSLTRSASHHRRFFLTRNRPSYIPHSNTEIIYAVPRAWSLKSAVC